MVVSCRVLALLSSCCVVVVVVVDAPVVASYCHPGVLRCMSFHSPAGCFLCCRTCWCLAGEGLCRDQYPRRVWHRCIGGGVSAVGLVIIWRAEVFVGSRPVQEGYRWG